MKTFCKKSGILFTICLAALTISAFGGCSLNLNMNENSQASASLADNSSPDASDEVISSEPSEEESVESTESSAEEVESSEESEESSEEESVMTESEALEASVNGYQFDDEQIVKDYHTAKEFTKNEEFNAIFKTNAIDAEFDKELRKAMSIHDMRNTTAEYMQKWAEEVDVAYNALYAKLEGNSEALAQLEASQQEWTDSASEAEESFAAEASEAGSEGILAADTAMMNYYKGRTAVLLEQIYEIDGSITLSDYGL